MYSFDTEVQYLKGVGPKLGSLLRQKGLGTLRDLLQFYPRAYEDRRAVQKICELREGQQACFKATIASVRSTKLRNSYRKMFEVVVSDSTGKFCCRYFRMPYKGYFENLKTHDLVRVSGKVIGSRGRLEIHHPEIHHVGLEGEGLEDVIIPIYSEVDGINPSKIRKLMGLALDNLKESKALQVKELRQLKISQLTKDVSSSPPILYDPLPQRICDRYLLLPLLEALRQVHKPQPNQIKDFEDFKSPCQRRVIFEEFFWLEIFFARQKQGYKREKGLRMDKGSTKVVKFEKSLPFELTEAQKKVNLEIMKDLKSGEPMCRLLQGDVGCGKTLVAFLAAIYAIDHGYQVALMVPTEILADQHFRGACQLLEVLGVRVDRLCGGIKASERELVLERLKQGTVDLCIGTHSLIQEGVEFKNLGLVVIDEQHRFGVEQRTQLQKKGAHPHFLIMTATPIPRTLAMTAYGDMDLSIIDELPPGRQTIITRSIFEKKREVLLEFLAEQIKKGRQAYVVFPLVEESEKLDLKDVNTGYLQLSKYFSGKASVGLMHGQMKSKEKDEVMTRFRSGEIQILVSTTVIEVGVDVPNANLMIVEHSERFGLSQLHQLRGRVGRGEHKSFCVLVMGPKASKEAQKRARVMVEHSDGFCISEEDLKMRGPGELIGKRQSGLLQFKMAELERDSDILEQAKEAAFDLVEQRGAMEKKRKGKSPSEGDFLWEHYEKHCDFGI